MISPTLYPNCNLKLIWTLACLVLTAQKCPFFISEIHGPRYVSCTNTHIHTHTLCGSCGSYIFHVTFHVTLCSTGQQTSAVSWKNDVSLCVWAPWEAQGVSTAADLMTLFAASWTPTGTRWNCSNGSRTIQSLMRRTTHTVSRSTIQSLLRGQGKAIKYL